MWKEKVRRCIGGIPGSMCMTRGDWYGTCDGFVILPADTVILISEKDGIILEK